jgi:hypothetical protein
VKIRKKKRRGKNKEKRRERRRKKKLSPQPLGCDPKSLQHVPLSSRLSRGDHHQHQWVERG